MEWFQRSPEPWNGFKDILNLWNGYKDILNRYGFKDFLNPEP